MKYNVNDRIRIIHDYNTTNKVGCVGFVERTDIDDSTLKYRIRLNDFPLDWEWVREQDIEPETVIHLGDKVLSIKEQIEAIEAALAVLKSTIGI